jgi:hypothetical protein
LAELLDAEDDIDVAGKAADGEQAVLLAERCAPDCHERLRQQEPGAGSDQVSGER